VPIFYVNTTLGRQYATSDGRPLAHLQGSWEAPPLLEIIESPTSLKIIKDTIAEDFSFKGNTNKLLRGFNVT
jgi:hypothetical protein